MNSATLMVFMRRVFAVLSARIPGNLASSQGTLWSDLKQSRANSAIWVPSGTTGMTLSESHSTVPGATQCRRSTEKAESQKMRKFLKDFSLRRSKERKKVDEFQKSFNFKRTFKAIFGSVGGFENWIC